jgi:hypothetical protein
MPAYCGKPTVRNFGGGRGNPKLDRARRAPLPYSAAVEPLAGSDPLDLRVHVYPMSNPRADCAIAHLLEHLNAAEFTYPGTDLRLIYSIAGDAETSNLAPRQHPADQNV